MADSQLPPESMPESVVEWLSEQDAATLREVQDHIDQLIEQRTDPITVEDIEPVDIGNSMFGPRTRIQKIEKIIRADMFMTLSSDCEVNR